MELFYLLKAQPHIKVIKEMIKVFMENIQHYGVSGIFNYHIYSFRILIFLLLYVLNEKLSTFTEVFGASYSPGCTY